MYKKIKEKLHELAIYRQLEDNAECVEVICQGTFDECNSKLDYSLLEDGQFFDIAELDEKGDIVASWKYYKEK